MHTPLSKAFTFHPLFGDPIDFPAGLRVLPATNLPEDSEIKYWLDELPATGLTSEQRLLLESRLRNEGIGLTAEQVEAPMNTTQHTPTPWTLEHSTINNIELKTNIVQWQKPISEMDEEHQANARFIVTACNNHDRLVEALKAEHEAYMEIAESNAHGRSCATCELLAEIEGQ